MKFNIVRNAIPFILIALMLSFASPAESTPIGDRSALPLNVTTIDFDDLVPGIDAIKVDTQYASLGVTFSGAEINMFAGAQLFASDTGRPAGISGIFSVDINVIGFDFVSSSPLTLVAYDSDDVLIGTTSSSANSGFLGLATGNSNIYSWKVHDSGHQFAIDNFSFGPMTAANAIPAVPEAGTLMLLGSGLLGLGIFRKKLKL